MNHHCARMILWPSVFKPKHYCISNLSKAAAICPVRWTCSEKKCYLNTHSGSNL